MSRPVLGYVLKGYPRISETFISNEILLMEKMGVKIHIFAMRHPRENFCHPSVEKINAEVTYLPTELVDDFTALIAPNLELSRREPELYQKALMYASEKFQEKGKSATLKHFLQAGFLVQTAHEKGINIQHLHGHFAHSPTSVTLFAAMLTGLPFSFTAHAKDIYTSSAESLREKMRHARFVATCTGYNEKYLSELRGDIDCPIHTIYHGIDLSLFVGEGKKEVKPPYQLLTVARLTEKKGIPTLLTTLKILKDHDIPFQHKLIGEGDDRAAIEAQIAELGLEQHCTLLGTKTHTEVLQEFRNSDLFVLPCQIAENGDRDGVPNVLVESLAMGVPALSTSVSAIPELLHHGKTGYLVNPQDPAALAEGIAKLVSDLRLRKTLQDNGRAFVEKYFNNILQTEKLRDVFLADNKSLGN